MLDQLIIGGKASCDDYGASVSLRKIGQPPKKTIKDTVPFSNITYDFSKINGEVYWENRSLEYEFEIIADNPEQLEDMKIAFADWIMNVMNEEIHDPFISEYHFLGTYEDLVWADDESLEKTVATVKFTAYPYKIANYPRVYEFELAAKETRTEMIVNKSSHPITPTISSNQAIVLVINSITYAVSAGEVTDEDLKLPTGAQNIIIQNSTGNKCAVKIRYAEEVF